MSMPLHFVEIVALQCALSETSPTLNNISARNTRRDTVDTLRTARVSMDLTRNGSRALPNNQPSIPSAYLQSAQNLQMFTRGAKSDSAGPKLVGLQTHIVKRSSWSVRPNECDKSRTRVSIILLDF